VIKQHHILDVELSYAEHPYVSAKYEGLELDIVICFDLSQDFIIKNGPITAVDRTPHHSRFIRNHLSQKQREDVCLFKHFLKCQHAYGDKSPVGRSGFIGYAVELLILHFGNLNTLLANFHELEKKAIKIYELNSEKEGDLNLESLRSTKYPNDFLIIFDPTDLNRNVGASISDRSYFWIKYQIRAFLINPSINFFQKKPLEQFVSLNLPQQERERYFFVQYRMSQDDHYTKFRDKCHSLLTKFIQFALWESTNEPRFEKVAGQLLFNVELKQYCIALYTSTVIISKTYIRRGPKKGNEPHFSTFLKKHPHSYEKENYICVEVPRTFCYFLDLVKFFFSQNPIENLEIQQIGTASERETNDIIEQSLANLYLRIIPFMNWNEKTYQKLIYD
jgi:tRNA nucleotidyltransferase (CCA-adding enzyme)